MTSQAFSQTRLARTHETMSRHVESGYVPGLVTLVARRDEVVVDAIGNMTHRDAIQEPLAGRFRIASRWKAIDS